jgi:hypothetical protein
MTQPLQIIQKLTSKLELKSKRKKNGRKSKKIKKMTKRKEKGRNLQKKKYGILSSMLHSRLHRNNSSFVSIQWVKTENSQMSNESIH